MGLITDRDSALHRRMEREHIQVIPKEVAQHQDIRPLEIGILNLMPRKEDTEFQFMRAIADTPLQINAHLLFPAHYSPKNTSKEHLDNNYALGVPHDLCLDGLIVTGAPVETLEYEEVEYWEEIKGFLDWADTHVTSTWFSCWGAMAGLHHHYGIRKHELSEKLSGIYWHTRPADQELTRGTDETFLVPHSRHTTIHAEDIEANPDLEILVSSERAGAHLVSNAIQSRLFCFGHPEYDRETLHEEYIRDLELGRDPAIPENYYPCDDPSQTPPITWRANGNIIMRNWVNFIYQTTPFHIEEIPKRVGLVRQLTKDLDVRENDQKLLLYRTCMSF